MRKEQKYYVQATYEGNIVRFFVYARNAHRAYRAARTRASRVFGSGVRRWMEELKIDMGRSYQ